jgi:hypothetical protein
MGKMGQGRGGLAPEEDAAVGFKIQRGKVHTGKGAIIGQFLVDGEQVKGDVSPEFAEIVTAAERDASDAVSRDRIPRQYQEAVKEYFSDVKDMVQGDPEDKKARRSKKSRASKSSDPASADEKDPSDDSDDK